MKSQNLTIEKELALYESIVAANNRLQRTLKGRGETLVASVKCGGRAPSKPLKRSVSRYLPYTLKVVMKNIPKRY